MTPHELKAARKTLGLKAIDLGRALQLQGDDPGRSVRLWEAGRPIPGPVAVAVGYMLAEQARQRLQEAVEGAQALLTPVPTSATLSPLAEAGDAIIRKTRRRGFTVIDPQRLR